MSKKSESLNKSTELKPYIWYPKDSFDGNPKGYIIVEREFAIEQDHILTISEYSNTLNPFTKYFMYIEHYYG